MTFQSLSRNWGIPLFVAIGIHASAQVAPGGVAEPRAWIHSETGTAHIANYSSLNLLELTEDEVAQKIDLGTTSTLFLVLQPSVESSSPFMKVGDMLIYGDRIAMPGGSVDLDFTTGEPAIITVEHQRIRPYATGLGGLVEFFDPSLFDLAEVVVIEGKVSREELRKVHSYLALKYSITITENDEPEWQDYIARGNQHYWDTRIDRLYKQRVIALGRSDNESFYQTQTITSSGDEMLISLGKKMPVGVMPEVDIDNESFMVFSERESTGSSSMECSAERSADHPLFRWKLQLQNWQAASDSLLIRIPAGKDIADSVMITDGQFNRFLPITEQDDEYYTYWLDLTDLHQYTHYFFTSPEQKDCDQTVVDVVGRDLRFYTDAIANGADRIEVQSLSDGSSRSWPVSDGRDHLTLEEGQHIVSITGQDGNLLFSTVVNSTGEADGLAFGENVDIRVYPNPVSSDQEAVLSIRNLPEESDVNITLSTASGQVLDRTTVGFEPHIERSMTFRTPGLYTVIVRQGTNTYTVKLIVRSDR